MTITGEFQQGDHVCAIYDSPAEQIAVAAAYVAEGLALGQRCLYASDSEAALTRFRAALSDVGVDAVLSERRGALLLKTKHEAHLVDGRFECERMLRMLNQAVEDALNSGFAGLRTCGDMSWLLDDAPGSEQVVEYEALLNEFFQSIRAVGMCQYDRARLPAGTLDHALATHRSVVLDNRHQANPFCKPSSVAATRFPQPHDLNWKIRELRSRR